MLSERYARSPFDGEGARLYGGRWNPQDSAVAYAAGTLSLAVLELLVHADSDLLPPDLVVAAATLPRGVELTSYRPEDLPRQWRSLPAPEVLQDLGSAWLRSSATLALQVPSAVIPTEPNYLINPAHPSFEDLEHLPLEPFPLDPRLRPSEAPPDA